MEKEETKTRAHALLSPSASHRWLNCTAAPLLEEKMPNKDTDYTKEGTLAHAYCAKALKGLLGRRTVAEDEEIAQLHGAYFTNDMLDHVETYATIVGDKYTRAVRKVKDSVLLVEERLDFTRWVPESFGTADALVISDDLMEVIDFKYGKGVEVSATWNPQMMIYALGALAAFEDEYNIRRVRMTIIQPRLNNLSEFEIEVAGLKWWAGNVLTPKAEEAISGKGKQYTGEWCRFCRCKTTCAKLAGECFAIAEQFADKETVSDEDMATVILPKLATIKAWASAMEEYALDEALKGKQYEGYKLVEGRSIRKITDPAELAARLLDNGFERDKIYKPEELETITTLEKLVGKKTFAELSKGVVDKPAGKPTLVPESDKREALNSAQNDFKDF